MKIMRIIFEVKIMRLLIRINTCIYSIYLRAIYSNIDTLYIFKSGSDWGGWSTLYTLYI